MGEGGATSGAEGGEDEMSEQNEGAESEQEEEDDDEAGIAVRRERREAKPNMMNDHIYFNKISKHADDSNRASITTKSQLRERRAAKQAAKEFERQKQKAAKSTPKIETNLDFSKFQIADDDEVNN